MKLVSESGGIERLAKIRSEFAAQIRRSYEHKAKPCSTCESPGICCRDEHFVNVRITRLEAAAIARRLDELDEKQRNDVRRRVAEAIERYDLSATDDPSLKTYACPLFEKGIGCLVHDTAKPLPCIAHACYEDPADMPPEALLAERETEIISLNRKVYGRDSVAWSLPLMVADMPNQPMPAFASNYHRAALPAPKEAERLRGTIAAARSTTPPER